MTFRLDPDLVAQLRHLPNQTAFVEGVLKDAFGRVCPVCDGSGEVSDVHLAVSNLKGLLIDRLDRAGAAQLKALVRLGRQLLATDLRLEASSAGEPLAFRLARKNQLLLTGYLPREESEPTVAN